MDRVEWVCFVLLMVFLNMIGIWLVDVGATGMNSGGVLNNGLWTMKPVHGYEAGLLTVMSTQFITALVAVKYIIESGDSR